MLVYGFQLAADDATWDDDPFSGQKTPEDEICEACHIYWDSDGRRYIGFEVALGMDRAEMEHLLLPYSDSLRIFSLV